MLSAPLQSRQAPLACTTGALSLNVGAGGTWSLACDVRTWRQTHPPLTTTSRRGTVSCPLLATPATGTSSRHARHPATGERHAMARQLNTVLSACHFRGLADRSWASTAGGMRAGSDVPNFLQDDMQTSSTNDDPSNRRSSSLDGPQANGDAAQHTGGSAHDHQWCVQHPSHRACCAACCLGSVLTCLLRAMLLQLVMLLAGQHCCLHQPCCNTCSRAGSAAPCAGTGMLCDIADCHAGRTARPQTPLPTTAAPACCAPATA